MRGVALWLALGPTALPACGGGVPAPTLQGRAAMLSRTAVAEKCEQAATGHDRPFVVEWDATDLASFEAKARSGTILVRYEGCKLVPLYECADSANPTRLGAYGTPIFTSGTTEGFDVKNEGELYAKLPLGAADLSGHLQAGESLHLSYFVAGVATSSRDAIYRGELDAIPACKDATHFVWAYNLGAFELSSSSKTAVGGEASGFGAAAGGERRHEESEVAHGGKLASCETQDQRACRVPIRLALRRVRPGQYPSAGPASAPPAAPDRQPEQAVAAQAVGQLIVDAADDINDKHDGQACLRELDRAAAIDPRVGENVVFKQLHARCSMRAGRCDEGTKDYRDMLAAEDEKRIKTDAMLDQEAGEWANRECPSSTAKTAKDAVLRAAREMFELMPPSDANACRVKFGQIVKRMPELQKDRSAAQARSRGTQALELGMVCVARTDSCQAARAMYDIYLGVRHPNATNIGKIAPDEWKRFAARRKLDCR